MEKLLLRPAEAADLLALGKSKVYQLLSNGTLPSLRIGKSIRVPLDALRQWARAQAAAGRTGH